MKVHSPQVTNVKRDLFWCILTEIICIYVYMYTYIYLYPSAHTHTHVHMYFLKNPHSITIHILLLIILFSNILTSTHINYVILLNYFIEFHENILLQVYFQVVSRFLLSQIVLQIKIFLFYITFWSMNSTVMSLYFCIIHVVIFSTLPDLISETVLFLSHYMHSITCQLIPLIYRHAIFDYF